jgi:hypothetical protein
MRHFVKIIQLTLKFCSYFPWMETCNVTGQKKYCYMFLFFTDFIKIIINVLRCCVGDLDKEVLKHL